MHIACVPYWASSGHVDQRRYAMTELFKWRLCTCFATTYSRAGGGGGEGEMRGMCHRLRACECKGNYDNCTLIFRIRRPPSEGCPRLGNYLPFHFWLWVEYKSLKFAEAWKCGLRFVYKKGHFHFHTNFVTVWSLVCCVADGLFRYPMKS